MIRKFLGAATVLAIGLGALAGCGPSGDSGSTTTGGTVGTATTGSTANSGKKLKIGVSIPAADHGWTAGVKYWAETAAKKYPDVDWIISTAATPDKQITDVETMMSNNIDGLVILATESAPLTPTAKDVSKRGIFLVSVDRGFLEPVADIIVEGDNVEFGKKSAEFIVQKLNGKGNIVVLEGIPSTVNTARVDAAKAVFAAAPGIKVLDSQSGMWNREKALNVMQSMLTKYPKIDAVWAADDDMALGAEQAIKEAGRQDQMWILGGAGMKDVVKRIMENDKMYPADITYPPAMIADGMEQAVTALRAGQGKKKEGEAPKHVKIKVDLITPENARDFYFPDSVY